MRTPSLVRDTRLLDTIPALRAMNECEHENRYHREGTVLDHSIAVMEGVAPSVVMRLAALFHDCGKPETKEVVGVKVSYNGHARVETGGHAIYHKHERVGESIAREELLVLGYHPHTVETICLLIRNHMYPLSYINQGPLSDKSVRRFIRKFEGNSIVNALDLLDLNKADILAHTQEVVERSMPGHLELRRHVERLIDDGRNNSP